MLFTMVLLLSGCGGTANVEQKQNDIFPFPCKTRERAYYVDKNGNEMESLNQALVNLNLGRWWEPGFFYDDVLRVDTKRDGERICLFLDENGNTVLNVAQDVFPKLFTQYPEYAKCSDFSRGIAFVKSGSLEPKVYAISKQGETLFEFEGTPTSGFNDKGEAFFRAPNGEYGVINDKGEVIMEPNPYVLPNHNGVPPVKSSVIVRVDNKCGIMTYNGQFIINPIFSIVSNLDDNDCVVFKTYGEGIGIADKSGKVLCQTDYEDIVNDGKWYYYTTNDNQVGWCDKNGEVKIGPLKKSDAQSKRSRYDWYPNPFFGSNYSVGTQTSAGEDGNCRFISGCLSVNALEELASTGNKYEFVANDPIEHGIVFISPMVNDRIIGIDPRSHVGWVYKVEGNKLVQVNTTGFYPKLNTVNIYILGQKALNPSYEWSGIDK